MTQRQLGSWLIGERARDYAGILPALDDHIPDVPAEGDQPWLVMPIAQPLRSLGCASVGPWFPQSPIQTLTVTARVYTAIPTPGLTVTCGWCGDQSPLLSRHASMSTFTPTTGGTVIRMV